MSEDLAADEVVFKVDTDDDNENDPYTCEIVNTNPVEPFYLERIPPVSGGTIMYFMCLNNDWCLGQFSSRNLLK